jgi:transposase
MEKKYIVRLTREEREGLTALVSKGRASARVISHARVLLKVDADGPNWTDAQTAEALEIQTNTVAKVRQRYVEEGLERALNRKRPEQPSRPRKLDGAGEARLIAVACGDPPEGRARWTLRLLTGRLIELAIVDGISHETIRQTLKKTAGWGQTFAFGFC